ncbi:MAG: glycosyl transferase [Nitratireductor sp.]|nr:glycosyl transferase [Nitratireductor sp.]
MTAPAVFFYVQHLLGIGHVFRATRVARGLARAGARVHLVWGGTRLPSIDLSGFKTHFLMPVRSDSEHFSGLVHPDGRRFTEADQAARRDELLALFHALRPDVVITEAFPFGRRQMRFELEPLMQAARAAAWRPMTVASIRDIMQEGRAQNRVAESLRHFQDWYDLLLVHGDPQLIRIEETLQGAEPILGKVRYTGLVTPDTPDMAVAPSIAADVVVSAGGGAVGHALTAAALGANRFSKAFPGNWLMVVGSERAEADFEALKAAAGEGMRVVRFLPDLARVMAGAKVSVSRAGYNTVGDLMRARCRAVLVPFAGGRETEQLRRARLFSSKGLATMLTDEGLTPERIGAAVDKALSLPPLNAGLDMEGAAHSARIVLAELETWKNAPGRLP